MLVHFALRHGLQDLCQQSTEYYPLLRSESGQGSLDRVEAAAHQTRSQPSSMGRQMQSDRAPIDRAPALDRAILLQAVDQAHGARMRKPEHLAEDFNRQAWRITQNDDRRWRFSRSLQRIVQL